ncbi:hypothetical protein JW992_11160 [candidate division KSB1 bacterium]|nr:hypothetical protein [candidate division KSB1 bacterium]
MIFTVVCYRCGYIQTIDRKLFRQDTCPRCSSYLRCCLMCRHYDRRAYHECKESEATWVRDKESANFCDYFELQQITVSREPDDPATIAKKKLEDLFKKKAPAADNPSD